MIHLGDITKISGYTAHIVDVVVAFRSFKEG